MSPNISAAPLAQSAEPNRFISLRWQLLAGFTLVFSGVFAAAYWWFYNFSTEKAIDRLQQELRSTAVGAAQGIDANELLALYKTGQRNAKGYSDDPRYQRQLDWFKTVHSISPKIYPYSYLVGKASTNRRIGKPAAEADDLEIIYVADSLWVYIPDRALKFLEAGTAYEASKRAFLKGETVERDLYTDQWGSWISAYTPIKDPSGKIVGVLGADIEADYVSQVRQQIRDRVFISFAVTYGTLFSLVYLMSGILTQRLKHLAEAAAKIGEGDYNQDLSPLTAGNSSDEISKLANVFDIMMLKVRRREETLKQQVSELKIEIDQVKRQKQVNEIVDSEFFQDLVVQAKKLRGKGETETDRLE